MEKLVIGTFSILVVSASVLLFKIETYTPTESQTSTAYVVQPTTATTSTPKPNPVVKSAKTVFTPKPTPTSAPTNPPTAPPQIQYVPTYVLPTYTPYIAPTYEPWTPGPTIEPIPQPTTDPAIIQVCKDAVRVETRNMIDGCYSQYGESTAAQGCARGVNSIQQPKMYACEAL